MCLIFQALGLTARSSTAFAPSHHRPCGRSLRSRLSAIVGPESPWAVQVYNHGRFACTGTMLTNRWMLTAYHCYDDETGRMSVRVGSVRIGHSTKVDVTKSRHL